MKNKIRIIGGEKKTTKTLEELIQMFREMPVEQIRTNLIKYTNRQIIKLDNLSKQKADKINDELQNDYENRKATKEKVERLIPGFGGIKGAYITNIDNGVKDFMEEYVTNHLAVQELNEYIKKFTTARNKLVDVQYILEYRTKCIALFLNDKVSEAFDEYKLELLEYLIMVLNGIKPEQHPFNIIITGNPGLGKSHLAGEIVKLLQSTHLLPIGNFINIKKPDVIGQYVGQTAPKAYRRLIGGIGSIIFIDEAYSFAGEKREGQGYDRFGLEFITAMVDFMEEFRGLIGIIAAGYDKEMKEQFLDVNTGLYRRFPIKLRMKELKPMMIMTRLYGKVQTPQLFRTKYIENFVRFSYHIQQESINQIRLLVFDRITGKYEKVEEEQYANILKAYFTFFFSNNWTDLQILFDYIQYNHGLDYTLEEQIQNTITQFMKFKLNSDDVIEIFSRFFEGHLIIHLKIKNLDVRTIPREELFDNEEMGTNQDKIDAMKQKVLRSIGDSRNNSAQNAERIEEIENRLIKKQQAAPALVRNNAVSMPPTLGLGKSSAANIGRYSTGGPPALGLSHQLTENLGAPPPLPLGKSSAANNPVFDFRNMPPPEAPPLRRSNTESYYDRKYSTPPPAVNSRNQGPPLLTLSNLPTNVGLPLFSFSRNASNSKAAPAPPAKKKEELPIIKEEEIQEEEPEKPKPAAKKKNKKQSKAKSRSKARR